MMRCGPGTVTHTSPSRLHTPPSRRSRTSGAPLRYRSRCTASGKRQTYLSASGARPAGKVIRIEIKYARWRRCCRFRKRRERVRVCLISARVTRTRHCGVKSLHHRRAYIAELLRAFSGIDLGGVDVALGVDGEIVHPVEFAGVAAVAAEGPTTSPVSRTSVRTSLLVPSALNRRSAAVVREVEVPDRARGPACSSRKRTP